MCRDSFALFQGLIKKFAEQSEGVWWRAVQRRWCWKEGQLHFNSALLLPSEVCFAFQKNPSSDPEAKKRGQRKKTEAAKAISVRIKIRHCQLKDFAHLLIEAVLQKTAPARAAEESTSSSPESAGEEDIHQIQEPTDVITVHKSTAVQPKSDQQKRDLNVETEKQPASVGSNEGVEKMK